MRFPALPAATSYRAQIARDRTFRELLAEQAFPAIELHFVALPVGGWWLRIRSVVRTGIEGQQGRSILIALALADDQFAGGEIGVLHAPGKAFIEPLDHRRNIERIRANVEQRSGRPRHQLGGGPDIEKTAMVREAA